MKRKTSRWRSKTGRLLAVAVLGVVAVGISAAPAKAVPPSSGSFGEAAARAMVTKLGNHTAGLYWDVQTGRLVVTVTDTRSAQLVASAGGTATMVTHGIGQLALVKSTLDSLHMHGTAWGTDVRHGQIELDVDPAMSSADLARLTAAIARFGDAVRIRYMSTTLVSDANPVWGGYAAWFGPPNTNSHCSIGFNVKNSTTGIYYFLGAGHCAVRSAEWYYDNANTIDMAARSQWQTCGGVSNSDYGVFRYTNNTLLHEGGVTLFNGHSQDITHPDRAVVGWNVYSVGATSKNLRTGVVDMTDFKIECQKTPTQYFYTDMVRVQMDSCDDPGDSGGPLWRADTDPTAGLGTLTGHLKENCIYQVFQPIDLVMIQFNLEML